MKRLDESKNGFWGVLARKAKSMIEDDGVTRESEMPGTPRSQFPGVSSTGKVSLYISLSSPHLGCCFVNCMLSLGKKLNSLI